MTGQRAACWAVLTPDGRFGYVSNAGRGTSGFAIGRDGSAELLDADGVTAVTGGNPNGHGDVGRRALPVRAGGQPQCARGVPRGR